jgi:RHS repeat-associated protein
MTLGRLIRRVESKPSSADAVTLYSFDGSNVWADLDASRHLQTRYLRGDRGQVWARESVDSQSQVDTFWDVADKFGSEVLVLSATGYVAGRARYNGFAQLKATGALDRFQYQGMEVDGATGLLEKGGRWYDSSTGRWMTQDRTQLRAGATNPYLFEGNSPTGDLAEPEDLDQRSFWDRASDAIIWANSPQGGGQAFANALGNVAGGFFHDGPIALKNLAVELWHIDYDIIRTGLSAATWAANSVGLPVDIYTFEYSSSFLGGYDRAVQEGPDQAGQYIFRAQREVLTMGAWGLGTTIGEAIKSGDPTHVERLFGAGLFNAVFFGGVTQLGSRVLRGSGASRAPVVEAAAAEPDFSFMVGAESSPLDFSANSLKSQALRSAAEWDAVAPKNLALEEQALLKRYPIEEWGEQFGKAGPGHAQLLKDLPANHPMRVEFEAMLREMERVGVPTKAGDLGPGIIAAVGGEDLATTGGWFRYNPERLRIVDFLEERIHWQQLQSGLVSRGYSRTTLEIMAKRGVLGAYGEELSPALKAELVNDIRRLRAGTYFPQGVNP